MYPIKKTNHRQTLRENERKTRTTEERRKRKNQKSQLSRRRKRKRHQLSRGTQPLHWRLAYFIFSAGSGSVWWFVISRYEFRSWWFRSPWSNPTVIQLLKVDVNWSKNKVVILLVNLNFHCTRINKLIYPAIINLSIARAVQDYLQLPKNYSFKVRMKVIVYIFFSFVVSIVMMTSLAIIVLHVVSLTFQRGQLLMHTVFFPKVLCTSVLFTTTAIFDGFL